MPTQVQIFVPLFLILARYLQRPMSRPTGFGILFFLFAASPQNRPFLLLQSSNILK